MWDITYVILFLAPLTYLWKLLTIYIQNKIFILNINKTKKTIIIISTLVYTFQSILCIIPFTIGIIINIYVQHIFNIYMLVSFFVISFFIMQLITICYHNRVKKNIGSKEEVING